MYIDGFIKKKYYEQNLFEKILNHPKVLSELVDKHIVESKRASFSRKKGECHYAYRSIHSGSTTL